MRIIAGAILILAAAVLIAAAGLPDYEFPVPVGFAGLIVFVGGLLLLLWGTFDGRRSEGFRRSYVEDYPPRQH